MTCGRTLAPVVSGEVSRWAHQAMVGLSVTGDRGRGACVSREIEILPR